MEDAKRRNGDIENPFPQNAPKGLLREWRRELGKESVQRKVASAPLFRLTKSSKRKRHPTLYLYNAPVNMDSSHQKGLRTRQKIARMLRDPLNERQTPVKGPKKNTKGGQQDTLPNFCSNWTHTLFVSSLGPFSLPFRSGSPFAKPNRPLSIKTQEIL